MYTSYIITSLNVTPKTTEPRLIVRSDKSEAYKKLTMEECDRRVVLLKLTS